MLRGRGTGLEILFADRDFEEALLELEGRLAQRPEFYRGVEARLVVGEPGPDAAQIAAVERVLEAAGLRLVGVLPQAAPLAIQRTRRVARDTSLSPTARSLVADFAGARADIATRRARGEASVPRVDPAAASASTPVVPAALRLVEPTAQTLFHVGTLRGGQALHQVGSLVVVGDVNPGAELVATGDILVFGRLAGTAHAGAQGDVGARIYALDLAATQLRIATCIAADPGKRAPAKVEPEAALVREGKIMIVPFSQIERYAPEEIR